MRNKRRPAPKQSSAKRGGGRKSLRAHAHSGPAGIPNGVVIPIRWLNTIIGLFLLPVAAVLTQAFFTCLSRETLAHGFWATEEFWFFGLGTVIWCIMFFGLPRPLWIYVFGHELTHAIWVWAMGGSVSDFKVSRHGGQIVTDTNNVWIALAPYFFPLYSIAVIAGYGAAGFFFDTAPFREALYALIGATWAFHVSFTLWMIPKGQTDLTYHGTFFSLVIVYLMNVIVLTLLLVTAAPHLTWEQFGRELLESAMNFSSWAAELVSRL